MREISEGGSTVHVKGWISYIWDATPAAATAATSVRIRSVDARRASAPEPLDIGLMYADMAVAGLRYGPFFRGLTQVHCRENLPLTGDSPPLAPPDSQGCGALGRISSPMERYGGSSLGSFLVHPASLDSAFQLGAAVKPGDSKIGPSTTTTYVPTAIALFCAARLAPSVLWLIYLRMLLALPLPGRTPLNAVLVLDLM